MKIVVTKEQLEFIRENDSKKFNCDKCDHSWKIKKEVPFIEQDQDFYINMINTLKEEANILKTKLEKTRIATTPS